MTTRPVLLTVDDDPSVRTAVKRLVEPEEVASLVGQARPVA